MMDGQFTFSKTPGGIPLLKINRNLINVSKLRLREITNDLSFAQPTDLLYRDPIITIMDQRKEAIG